MYLSPRDRRTQRHEDRQAGGRQRLKDIERQRYTEKQRQTDRWTHKLKDTESQRYTERQMDTQRQTVR